MNPAGNSAISRDASAAAASPTSSPVAPPLVVYMRCTENDEPNDYEGGAVRFAAIGSQEAEVNLELIDARFIFVAKTDGFLRQFPLSRDEKQATYFKVTVERVPVDSVPPDPNAPVELFDAQGRRRNPDGSLVIPIQFKPATAVEG